MSKNALVFEITVTLVPEKNTKIKSMKQAVSKKINKDSKWLLLKIQYYSNLTNIYERIPETRNCLFEYFWIQIQEKNS